MPELKSKAKIDFNKFSKKSSYEDCSTGSLAKFSGEWNFDTAAHLLRRTTFGAKGEEIQEYASISLDESIESLFTDLELPSEPINYNREDDPNVGIGESWVNQPIERSDVAQMIAASRRNSLQIWQFDLLLSGPLNIQEQLTLFWHNHFVVQSEVIRDANFLYHYITTLRTHSKGNFKTLTELMTIDPSMLRYLNGNQNTNRAPNENYARELLELFTIGKGDLAGPEDYTTFTEQDVIEAAKVLTGWVDQGYNGFRNNGVAGSTYVRNRHDTSTKTLSNRFGNAEITDQGEDEYKVLIDIIFEQEEVSKFIVRKLYRWFVYYEITSEIEETIIAPLAAQLRESDYEITPMLKTLLSSEHFYSICSVGPMIKSPIVFTANLFRQSEVSIPDETIRRYQVLRRVVSSFEANEMAYFNPPNVAGWKAYYQEPLFYRTWISSVTLRQRQNLTDAIASGAARVGGFPVTVDLIDYISRFKDPFDPNTLIDEFVSNLLPQPISTVQRDFLKEILIPGLPDFEWTVEYEKHLNDPSDDGLRQSVDQKLRDMFGALIKMPEYYLS